VLVSVKQFIVQKQTKNLYTVSGKNGPLNMSK